MPNYLTAKDIADRALQRIGAFPATQSQADAGELRRALQWLDMLLNDVGAKRPIAGRWSLLDIPLEAGVGDYDLADYVGAAGDAQHVFSVNVVDGNGRVTPATMLWEEEAAEKDLNQKGSPCSVVVTRDIYPQIKVYPEPVQADVDNGRVLRLRLQTYAEAIDYTGIADSDPGLRPGWYLWASNALAYEIGNGPVRRLNEDELTRIQKDANTGWADLLARDGLNNTGSPPVTEPFDF